MKKNSFETQILHTPFEKEDAHHSLSMPVYHTAAYEFETAEEMEAAFCGRTAPDMLIHELQTLRCSTSSNVYRL